ncbi:Retrovirus-related Pol polyprotein from transposon 17.6, partial [Mucuna pruriens]
MKIVLEWRSIRHSDAVNALDLDLDPRGRCEHMGPHPAEDLKEIQLGCRPEQTTKIRTAMNHEEEDLLVAFLKANHDVFTWSAQDMPGVDPDFMCHRLSIEQGAKPVTQKKRKQGEEKSEAAREETRKLLSAGFVREVQYPTWLANVVMVKKPNGKWRMCTDYTDRNKACPKDPYPLPNIDRLVDSIAGFALLSFMDAYSGVMPFGLKNAGATYQRLMDKIFQGVLGADVEVYVDDMVVKSQGVAEHCEALGRVFHTLRKHQLRLNPGKCSFGVHAGKFLGFMLTERGIEANLEKCQAVTNMRSPQSVKEVQQFMGKVTALSRFISKAAETTTPLFATLKKGGKFTWMAECEEAFLRLKAMMAAPLVLICPSPVRTDLPIRKVLRKPDMARRMVAWSAQGHVKAQALADFITELTPEGPPTDSKGEWYLSVDGSTNQSGSGVGVILEGLDGVLIEKSLHFDFRASNNQAEYEALLAGMRLARDLEARSLTAKNDLKLVMGQVNNEYQTRDPQMAKYRERAVKLAAKFEKFELIHVLRDQNEWADLLAKLAST